MDKKVILVSVDGMRPDGFESCGSFCIEKLKRECAYTLRGRSVMPSVTLPCHMTMFHGVAPARHHDKFIYAASTPGRGALRAAASGGQNMRFLL